MNLTVELLRGVLHYDPMTGLFTWLRETRPNRPVIGTRAGSTRRQSGYHHIKIYGRVYQAHRLAWLYVHGEWPAAGLDHKDGCPDHNWIDNLRPADQTQNNGNARLSRANTSGFKGVYFNKSARKWVAQVKHMGEHFYLGIYNTPEKAHAAYIAAAEKLFGQFARAA